MQRLLLLKSTFSLNHESLYLSPEGPLKVPCRSRNLGPLENLQGISLGRRVPAGNGPVSKEKQKRKEKAPGKFPEHSG